MYLKRRVKKLKMPGTAEKNELSCRVEQEGLVKQVDIMQHEKENLMAENVELKGKQEQLETWIEEERNRNEILQSEIQKKVQEGFDMEEERVRCRAMGVSYRMYYKVW